MSDERLYSPEYLAGAYDTGHATGENTVRKLWRSGWRGATLNESDYNRGFAAGFTKALAELWRQEP